MTRRCSHCSNNGHNSRTCPTRMGQSTAGGGSGSSGGKAESGVKLFGVRLTEGGFIMKKSASMGCLSHYSLLAAQASPNRVDSNSSDPVGDNDRETEGYASDDPNHESCSTNRRGERKKGVPWTEEEHRMFLVGLQKLGKGDWRGIARNFVLSKTPTQVASHAQKYFIRQTNSSRRKRRSSLFDMVPDMNIDRAPITEEQILHSPPKSESSDNLPSIDRNSERESVPEEPAAESMDLEETISFNNLPPLVPAFYPAFIPVPYAYWPPSGNMPVNEEESTGKTHEVLKPIPVVATNSTYAVELIGMSQLSLSESRNNHSMKPSALSSKLLAAALSRQSAFHANPAVAGSDVSQRNSGDIHAA